MELMVPGGGGGSLQKSGSRAGPRRAATGLGTARTGTCDCPAPR